MKIAKLLPLKVYPFILIFMAAPQKEDSKSVFFFSFLFFLDRDLSEKKGLFSCQIPCHK